MLFEDDAMRTDFGSATLEDPGTNSALGIVTDPPQLFQGTTDLPFRPLFRAEEADEAGPGGETYISYEDFCGAWTDEPKGSVTL
jgi:hypothetical protein